MVRSMEQYVVKQCFYTEISLINSTFLYYVKYLSSVSIIRLISFSILFKQPLNL